MLLLKLLLKIIPKSLHYKVEIFLEKLLSFTKKVFSGHDEIIQLNIEKINFLIKARKNNLQAHTVYKKMSNEKNIYEVSMLTCLRSILDDLKNKKIIFLDIGAFVGYYTFYVAKYKNLSADIISIESNPEFAKDILEAIKLNNLNNITVLNETLSDKVSDQYVYREMSIEIDNQNKYNEIDKNFLKEAILKKSNTLDNLNINLKKSENSVNILKIDAHGAEAKILGGGKKILQDVNYILLELHTDLDIETYSPGYTKKKVILDLIENNFNCYLISPHADIRTKLRKMEKYRKEYYQFKKKLEYIQIDKENCHQILFDRNLSDIFILAVKKGYNLDKLSCFS